MTQNTQNVKVGSTVKFRDYWGENKVWQGTVLSMGKTIMTVGTRNGDVFRFVTPAQIVEVLN